MLKLLVDADLLAYRSARVTESAGNIDLIIQKQVNKIRKQFNTETDVIMYIGTKNSFRRQMFPTYKQNRNKGDTPELLHLAYKSIKKNYVITESDILETDDMLVIGYDYYKCNNINSVICSYDKDLLQAPSVVYDFKKEELHKIDILTANFNFWTQVLTGDPIDNYKGVPGIGKVKAGAILNSFPREEFNNNKLIYDKILQQFNKLITKEYLHSQMNQAYILRGHNYDFKTKRIITITDELEV